MQLEPDPRVTTITVYRHRGVGPFDPGARGSVLVCETTRSVCVDRGTLQPRQRYRYEAIAHDEWGASLPRLSHAVVVGGPGPPAIQDGSG